MLTCPTCAQPMREHTTEGFYGRSVVIDVCHTCCAIWFDNQELLQMTPAATLQLLAELANDKATSKQSIGPTSVCPRCRCHLVETHDQQHNTKFWDYRCPANHGRFMPYFQFLRAKNVVRPLDDAELEQLRRRLRQVQCANCGAPIDVQKGAVCGFCGSALAILDPDQIQKVADEVKRAQAKAAAGPDPTLPLTLAIERQRAERTFAEPGRGGIDGSLFDRHGEGEDLITAALQALGQMLARR